MKCRPARRIVSSAGKRSRPEAIFEARVLAEGFENVSIILLYPATLIFYDCNQRSDSKEARVNLLVSFDDF
jgi:hypothetical protein